MRKVPLESATYSVIISSRHNVLFFIRVLDALSKEIMSGCPEELLYADHSVYSGPERDTTNLERRIGVITVDGKYEPVSA